MKIFTRSYHPFVMGGDCHSTIAIEIPDPEWVEIGLGLEGAPITDPYGNTHVVDKISGGIVGSTLEEVRRDIESCGDVEFMRKQSKEQKAICDRTRYVNSDVFWNMK